MHGQRTRFARTLMLGAGLAAAAFGAQAAHASTYKVIYTAPSGTTAHPATGIMYRGTLYGVDPVGGSHGTLFSLSLGGIYTTLYSFTGGADGATPNTRLQVDAAGALYGTTQAGGSGGGTVFKFAAGQLTVLHTFSGGTDGNVPLDGLTRDVQGNFYGTTGMGAFEGSGAAFIITPSGQFTLLHEFQSGTDGHCPFTGVSLAPHGVAGTVVGHGFGGLPNGGVFRMSTTGVVTTLYAFTNGKDGGWPEDAPVVDSHGNIYGVTHLQNGNPFPGAIYKVSAAGAFSVLYNFTGNGDGYGPVGRLLIDSQGDLIGTTQFGGTSGDGTVFSLSPSNTLSVLHTFTGGADGANPAGGLIYDKVGNIRGGTQGGTLFEITP